ncbi:sugar phosphate isomerase/epimerase [Paraflavitalea soli]|uniref:Sugar phosphate isomerase/epimerase n=1 Tax=Paraflavitalea soli TaxID=2315862 RepID=A0A3B7MIH2_9BACT|nr:sugar phosphate isomerase/epimerase [Paraflavitalea soli]AXY74234.1 sugar phosphate isomerase/epimerase [Paraflavitalea soli]
MMNYSERMCCAYLYIISKYGYPPPVEDTVAHIAEMAGLGFRHIELEGIGKENIDYLYHHRAGIAEALKANDCSVPIFCIVLPQLGSVNPAERSRSLALFEKGCATAKALGAEGVLDNGPLLPLTYPADMPVMRHYNDEILGKLLPAPELHWNNYWQQLTATYKAACHIAAKYDLDYHLHPCEGSLTVSTDAFINFSQAVDEPNLYFNLDTANQYFMKENLSLSVLRLADKISYIHISDNGGLQVEHQTPGDGTIYWDGFFSTLQAVNYKGRIAIDVGGAETNIQDIEQAYRQSAGWLDQQINRYLS